MEDENEIIKTLSAALENVTNTLADVVKRQIELHNRQLDFMEKQREDSMKLINKMFDSANKDK